MAFRVIIELEDFGDDDETAAVFLAHMQDDLYEQDTLTLSSNSMATGVRIFGQVTR